VTNPCRKPAAPSVPAVDASALVHSTLPAGIAAFPAANVMPTATLAPIAKFARPEAVATDVSVATVAAYSILGATIMDDAEMGVQTVKAVELRERNPVIVQDSARAVASAVMPTVVLTVTANFVTAEDAATDVSVATVAAYSASTATVDSAAASFCSGSSCPSCCLCWKRRGEWLYFA
jgi:hypothetical protein